jgi:hypothetical protein
VLRAFARKRIVETENPSACATVNWKDFKLAIVLYCLYLSVIKRDCVTKVLINPIIRTITRRFVTPTILRVTIYRDHCQCRRVQQVMSYPSVLKLSKPRDHYNIRKILGITKLRRYIILNLCGITNIWDILCHL